MDAERPEIGNGTLVLRIDLIFLIFVETENQTG